MRNEWFTFETRVCGIPCIVAVSYPTPHSAGDFWNPEEGGEWDYEIRDRQGRKAGWLKRKLDADPDRHDSLIKEIEWEMKDRNEQN